MPKLYDMWTELKVWLEIRDSKAFHNGFQETLDKIDELESEYE
jgi:hypothetical protein